MEFLPLGGEQEQKRIAFDYATPFLYTRWSDGIFQTSIAEFLVLGLKFRFLGAFYIFSDSQKGAQPQVKPLHFNVRRQNRLMNMEIALIQDTGKIN
jgi:hypothetical protein